MKMLRKDELLNVIKALFEGVEIVIVIEGNNAHARTIKRIEGMEVLGQKILIKLDDNDILEYDVFTEEWEMWNEFRRGRSKVSVVDPDWYDLLP